MPRIAVPILKFVGTISLGLLTGISYTHAHLTAPTLLTLPSATTASTTYAHLRRQNTLHSNALLVLSIASYTLAYALSPPKGGRHPYLLWTSLLASISYGVGYFLDYKYADQMRVHGAGAGRDAGFGLGMKGNGNGSGEEDDYVDATHSSANIMTPTSGSEAGEGSEKDAAVNGEQVRMGLERFGFVEGIKRGITGAAFFMGVVGIWGDGVGMARQ